MNTTPKPDIEIVVNKHGFDGDLPEYREARGKWPGENAPVQNLTADRLEWLLEHHIIEEYMADAGHKFRKTAETAGISAFAHVDYEAVRSSGGVSNISDTKADAKDALRKVAAAIGNMNERVLIDLTVFNFTLGALEKKHRWQRGGAGPVVRHALDTLARFYGMA